jgi:hypothetical protein
MAFLKRSVAVTTPQPTMLTKPTVGEEREGMIWDGATWIPKAMWEVRTQKG